MTVSDQTAEAGRRTEAELQPQGGTASLPNPEHALEKFFHGRPLEMNLYGIFAAAVQERLPHVITRFRRNQITFSGRRGFAAVWIPPFKVRGRPEHYIVVSFAADRRIDHPRIVSVAEPYPHRWTHHVLVSSPEDVDDKLLDWVEQAYRLTNARQIGK